MDDVGFVGDSVYHRRRHHRVPEQRRPFVEWQVRREHHRLPFASVRQEVEKQFGPLFVEGDVTQFVEYDQIV